MSADFFKKRGSLFLAPMSAYTDSPFRTICRGLGADVCASEFVHSNAVLAKAKKILDKLEFEECQRPYGIQIFGSEPSLMADAAAFLEGEFKPDFIDLNYGCPAPNAVDAGAGASLLKDIPKMAKIASAVVEAVKIPVSAKMRTGWNSENLRTFEAAKALQDAGISALALHGRTKAQGYSGDADWPLIESVAEGLAIPVIGNGSVEKLGAEHLASSACSGFMIGRAAIGNPWIFSEIKARMAGGIFEPPSPRQRLEAAIFYLDKVAAKADKYAFINVRASVMAFLKGFSGSKEARREISNAADCGAARRVLEKFLNR